MKLDEYLFRTKKTIEEFANETNMAYTTMCKAVHGKDIKLSTGVKIELATKGLVKCIELLSEDLVKSLAQENSSYTEPHKN